MHIEFALHIVVSTLLACAHAEVVTLPISVCLSRAVTAEL